MDYEAGIVHLSSSDEVLLEIPENKLSGVDRNYIRSWQDAYRRGQREVTSYLFHVPFYSLILPRSRHRGTVRARPLHMLIFLTISQDPESPLTLNDWAFSGSS